MALRVQGEIELSAEEGDEIVVQPAAAVIAGIHDEGFLVDIFSQDLIECDAEAGVVHASYVEHSRHGRRRGCQRAVPCDCVQRL